MNFPEKFNFFLENALDIFSMNNTWVCWFVLSHFDSFKRSIWKPPWSIAWCNFHVNSFGNKTLLEIQYFSTFNNEIHDMDIAIELPLYNIHFKFFEFIRVLSVYLLYYISWGLYEKFHQYVMRIVHLYTIFISELRVIRPVFRPPHTQLTQYFILNDYVVMLQSSQLYIDGLIINIK